MNQDPHDIIKREFEDSLISAAEDRAAQAQALPHTRITDLEQLVSNLRRDLQVAHQALVRAQKDEDRLDWLESDPDGEITLHHKGGRCFNSELTRATIDEIMTAELDCHEND